VHRQGHDAKTYVLYKTKELAIKNQQLRPAMPHCGKAFFHMVIFAALQNAFLPHCESVISQCRK
jgi:hypothetical protein